MSKRIWRKVFIWCALATLGLSQLVSLTPVMVQAAGHISWTHKVVDRK